MFGFPPILDGNAGIKFTRDADSGFPKPGIREIFYSVRDGNWGDRGTWQTASGRVGLLPTANDDVYIRHTVTVGIDIALNLGTMNFSAYNLFISGTLIVNTGAGGGRYFAIANNIQCTGTLDISLLLTGVFYVRGSNNSISNFIAGTTATFEYNGIDQDILNLPYWNLTAGGTGIKKLTSNITVLNSLIVNTGLAGGIATLDTMCYDLTVNGTTSVANGILISSGGGNITFVGGCTFNATSLRLSSGNPNVEFRGGITFTNQVVDFGTGNITFSTNNQTVNITGGGGWNVNFNNKILISGSIRVTFSAATATNTYSLTDTINGSVAGSTLAVNNATFNFATLASVPSMTTGTWDFTTNANTIQYSGNYSATIPSYFTNFHNLTIGGTGTKTLGVNTTLNGNLTVSNGQLDKSSFNLTINGTTAVGTTATTPAFISSGGGNIIFVGLVTLNTGWSNNNYAINFNTGNPNVEMRGGMTQAAYDVRWLSGTGTWTFTTNNQNFVGQGAGVLASGLTGFDLDATFVIQGAITVTNTNYMPISSTINGTVAGSTLLMSTNSTINFGTANSALNSMTTGTFDYSTNLNTVQFNRNYSVTIPSNYSTFRNLTIGGGGTKTASSNITVNNNLSSTGLQLSTFNLTVNGTTNIGSSGNGIFKSGAGSVLFVGLVSCAGTPTDAIDFSGGNPTVELRGGLTINFASVRGLRTGTGQWSITTNSQTFTFSGNAGAISLDCPILIGNGITLTVTSTANASIFTGVINGSNVTSTLLLSANSLLNYQNTTQPMATGILDTSTNLNTFIYGAGNQDVKGNPTAGQFQQYRNLRFSGSGTTKRLLGNINVQNTYTVDAGVTVNLNGFSKTP